MKAAIIAAGLGERLRAGGHLEPKPLVRINGVPLIDYVLSGVAAAGLTEVACIVNEESRGIENHCTQRWPQLRFAFVRRTTPSSMESLFALQPLLSTQVLSPDGTVKFLRKRPSRRRQQKAAPQGERKRYSDSESMDSQTVRAEALEARSSDLSTVPYEGECEGEASDDRFLLLTVDSILAPGALQCFVTAGSAYGDADVVLAVTDFVDDEKPLWVTLTAGGRISALGSSAAGGGLVTAGFYMLHPRIFGEMSAARDAGCIALRQFFSHLAARGYRLYGQRVPTTIDVDRPEDIATAEAFVRNGFA